MAYRKSAPNGVGGLSTASREIAALDFLLNIPLEAEQEIVRSGLEAEQNSILSNSGGGGTIGGATHNDRSYSIDEDEKFELEALKRDVVGDYANNNNNNNQNQNEWHDSSSLFGNTGLSEYDDNTTSWWQPMIKKNKEFFSAEDERIKRREQLELETGILEAPDEIDALSAMEEGNLTHISTTIGQETGDGRRMDGKSNSLSRRSSTANSAKSVKSNLQTQEDLYGQKIVFAPGRRLDGYEARRVKIPREEAQTELKTTMRTVVRKAAVREWEREMISSSTSPSRDEDNKQSLLDGRIFFSGMSSYPMAVFSVIKYEPRKEEETRRRQRLAAAGGGGSKFVMPSRDWRGVSYRALLPRGERKNKAFNRMIKQGRKDAFMRREKRLKRIKRREKRRKLQKKKQETNDDIETSCSDASFESNTISIDDTDSDDFPLFENEMPSILKKYIHDEDDDSSNFSSSSSEDSISYYPGFLDDPEMTFGRHRHVMVGDRVTGCVVSSTIHFVSPVDLKADLNKQFRERFEQWEPPKQQRKYIGARVIEGCYTLVDPTECTVQQEDNDKQTTEDEGGSARRKRRGSITKDIETIRMPPSLTLSKIRKLKQQALHACIDCNIEVSTVALACVYFERLSLDCRVDKSNRRLTFAACLLIAIKTNEANTALVNEHSNKISKKGVGVIKSWIKSREKGDDFASLLEFFTSEWSLSLKELFAAEFGVFAALNFKLHATPSQISFHFKRMMKTLEWSSRDYLGKEMYEQWQNCLSQEALDSEEKEHRQEERKQRKEKELLKLQHELQMMEEVKNDDSHRSLYNKVDRHQSDNLKQDEVLNEPTKIEMATPPRKKGLFNRLRFSHNNLTSLVSSQKLESSDDFQSNMELKQIKLDRRLSTSKSTQNL